MEHPARAEAAAASPAAARLQRWQAPQTLPRWFVWLLALVAALALLLAWSQWRRLNHIQEKLALQSGSIHEQAIEARTLSQEALALARDSAAKASLGEARINEYTLQRSRIEQLAFELSRSRDETMLNDIEASLRLAQQQAQLTGLADPLIAALRNAGQRVDRADQPRLAPIQRAIEHDLQRLTSTVVTDTAGLLGRIDRLLAQLEYLPLASGLPSRAYAPDALEAELLDEDGQKRAANANTAGAPQPAAGPAPSAPAPTDAKPAPSAEAAAQAPAQAPTQTQPATSAPAEPDDANAQDSTHARGGIWHSLRSGLGDLVRVQRIDAPEAALLNQEQAFFLRENIRLQLMNARMGLLARQSESARSDLAAVQNLIQKYYDTQAPRTRQALRTLKLLQDHIQSVQPPAITETLVAIQAAHMPPVPPTPVAPAGPAAPAAPAPGAP